MEEVEFKQRAYDGKWEMIQKVMDPENAYYTFTETGGRIRMIPEKWMTVGVYDYLITLED